MKNIKISNCSALFFHIEFIFVKSTHIVLIASIGVTEKCALLKYAVSYIR